MLLNALITLSSLTGFQMHYHKVYLHDVSEEKQISSSGIKNSSLRSRSKQQTLLWETGL